MATWSRGNAHTFTSWQGRDTLILDRYSSLTKPESIHADIETLLKAEPKSAVDAKPEL